jgi:hypothetical protein
MRIPRSSLTNGKHARVKPPLLGTVSSTDTHPRLLSQAPDTRPNLSQWNLACTPPYRTPSTLSSNTSPALSMRMSSVKSRLSNSMPFVVVRRVNRLLGTELRSVVSVHTLMRPLRNDSGAVSESQAMRSSSTTRDCPGRKLRV